MQLTTILFDGTVELTIIHFIQQYSWRLQVLQWSHFKKQPIVQLEPLDLVSTVQLNTAHLKYSFLVRLGLVSWHLVVKGPKEVDTSEGMAFTGLHPLSDIRHCSA